MSMEIVLAEAVIDSGDTAWVLISAGLVLFMVPGLAFFYAGLVRGSSALVMLQQNLVPLGLVSITWVVFGYSFAFSETGVPASSVTSNCSACRTYTQPPPRAST
ncbi:hypothetical protein ACSW29_03145 [Rhodococcus sp. GB-02]